VLQGEVLVDTGRVTVGTLHDVALFLLQDDALLLRHLLILTLSEHNSLDPLPPVHFLESLDIGLEELKVWNFG